MKIIYLLIICVLCAVASARNVYILITKELSFFEVCVFVFLALFELMLIAVAAATIAREI
jgi:Na+-transporting NADH:ubiquinone oxidoreductase subunit NqrE